MTATATASPPRPASILPWSAIPEPPSPGLGGHARAWLGYDNARTVLQRLASYAEHGPLTRWRVGPVRMLLVSDPELAGEVLSAAAANYKGAVYILTRVVLDNVLLLNGEAWARYRKAYRGALRNVAPRGVAREVTARFTDGLLASAGAREPVQLDRAMNRLVRDIVGGFVAGVTLPDELEPHRHRVQYELAAVGIDLQCQPWTYLSARRWVALRRSVAALRGFFREAVRERLARPDDRPDILNGFISLARAGEYPSDVDALQEGIVNFFFSATDVLSSTAGWTAWLLATHPAIQERLRTAVGNGPADIDDNEYLGQVTKEALRLFPGYSLFGRTTQDDLVIGEYRVPKGTMLLFSPFVTHRLNRYWPEAERFLPERWSGRGLGAPPPAVRDHYLPFGSGLRGCLAAHLATPLLKEIVAGVIPRARLHAVEGHQPEIVYWGTTLSANGLPAHVTPVG
jgi:cytochrome P450